MILLWVVPPENERTNYERTTDSGSLPTYPISFRQRNQYLPKNLWYTDDDDDDDDDDDYDDNFKSFIYMIMGGCQNSLKLFKPDLDQNKLCLNLF
jgi:2-polyprenyl-6-methoxyphenol hydroxylase-like FAD-dependent oxidoreductase